MEYLKFQLKVMQTRNAGNNTHSKTTRGKALGPCLLYRREIFESLRGKRVEKIVAEILVFVNFDRIHLNVL
jgi:hypothetical protein